MTNVTRTFEATQILVARDYLTLMQNVYHWVEEADKVADFVQAFEEAVRVLLRAERLTIYSRAPNGAEIVSWYRTGGENAEIREPLSLSSVAGYVATTRRGVVIADVYDRDELQAINSKLRFDARYDEALGFRTKAMLAVPILFRKSLLGVLQIINRTDGAGFSPDDLECLTEVAGVLGQKFRIDLQTTASPYEHLVALGALSAEELAYFEQRAQAGGQPTHRLLLKEGGVVASELASSLEQYYLVPFLAYDPARLPDSKLLSQLDPSFLARERWCPFRDEKGTLVIMIDNPNDTERIMAIQHLCDASEYELRVGLPEDILRYLGFVVQDEPGNRDLAVIVNKMATDKAGSSSSDNRPTSEILDAADSTIINLVNRLIQDAADSNCSDIHINPMPHQQPAVVSMRVDGVCHKSLDIPASHVSAVIARIKVLASLDLVERRKPQDGQLTVTLRGRQIELRVATLPTVYGESAALRLLTPAVVMPLDGLGLLPHCLQPLQHGLAQPHGMLLVVGPTGSGKTTTLHGILGYLNTGDVRILTAEDPVEITQAGLVQVQVQPRIGYTFAIALRAFLRNDPDIILVGEMRDRETAQTAIQAALTGHFVLSTLHTNSAPETVTRLLDIGLDPLNFADCLVGILAQRLVRTLCGRCKQPYDPSEAEIATLQRAYGAGHETDLPPLAEWQCAHAVGCEACAGVGYKGRMAIHELLMATPAMRDLVSRRATVTEIRTLAQAQGMRSLRQDGILKVLRGELDYLQVRTLTAD